MGDKGLQLNAGRRLLALSALLMAGVGWMGLIFVFGLMPYPPSLTDLPPGSESYLEHAVTHFALGVLIFLLLSALSQNVARNAALAFVITVGIGGALEMAQMFVPQRTVSALDLLSDAIGAAVGVTFVALFVRYAMSYERTVVAVVMLTIAAGLAVSARASATMGV